MLNNDDMCDLLHGSKKTECRSEVELCLFLMQSSRLAGPGRPGPGRPPGPRTSVKSRPPRPAALFHHFLWRFLLRRKAGRSETEFIGVKINRGRGASCGIVEVWPPDTALHYTLHCTALHTALHYTTLVVSLHKVFGCTPY